MKKISKLVLVAVLAFGMAFIGINQTNPAFATTSGLEEGVEAARCDTCPSELFGDTGVFRQITNTILYFVGIIAVVMLIWGGIRYIVSGGDAKKVTDAKNTILYAIIGLVIAFLAYAIVQFVIDALPAKKKQETNQVEEQKTSLIVDVNA